MLKGKLANIVLNAYNWDEEYNYSEGDFCFYNNFNYKSLQSNNINNIPTQSSSYWQIVTIGKPAIGTTEDNCLLVKSYIKNGSGNLEEIIIKKITVCDSIGRLTTISRRLYLIDPDIYSTDQDQKANIISSPLFISGGKDVNFLPSKNEFKIHIFCCFLTNNCILLKNSECENAWELGIDEENCLYFKYQYGNSSKICKQKINKINYIIDSYPNFIQNKTFQYTNLYTSETESVTINTYNEQFLQSISETDKFWYDIQLNVFNLNTAIFVINGSHYTCKFQEL